jgi:glyoxylase-like metal-dependent hydrolase (beta-lactamase superfamily II)
MAWDIDVVVVGPIQCNCYILSDSITRQAYIIDPGAESKQLLSYLENKKFDLKGVLITHAHLDHVGGIQMLQSSFPVPVFYHSGDQPLYSNLQMQADLFGFSLKDLQASQPIVGEPSLKHAQEFSFSSGSIQVIHTPGHTPGSVCFHTKGEMRALFTGDTLFEGSIGRTDLWGGSFEQIMDSIRNRLLTLDDDLSVLPGHGAPTTIGEERESNPFLQNRI